MRYFTLLAVDLTLLMLATLIAFALRENFEFAESRFEALLPYLGATVLMATILVPVAGLNQSIWRFSGLHDYVRVSSAVTVVCAGAVAMSFGYNRLEGVARSLPILQGIAGIAVLVGARVLHRSLHAARQSRKLPAATLHAPENAQELYVLIVGVSRLTKMYIRALAEFDPEGIRVAGLLGRVPRHVGRVVGGHPILGVAEDIESVLDVLEVRGIAVERIVVADRFARLAPAAQKALLQTERSRGLTLQLLTEVLSLEPGNRATSKKPGSPCILPAWQSFEIPSPELHALLQGNFWRIKRGLDAAAALGLIVLLAPLFLFVAIGIAGSLGFPVVFRQRRPGLAGRSFQLYKFRTMQAIHGPNGRRLQDAERTSGFGNFLRRTRLDELPQLLNILRGDMSFVGPRPLLPRDQPGDCPARLQVRPGLTGWAQVVGGRDISPEDKAALDVWYVRNASFFLDLQIAVRTVPVLLFGERVSAALIEHAWRDLNACGIAKDGYSLNSKNACIAEDHV